MPEILQLNVDQFVFKVPTERFYTTTGVWVEMKESRVRVGVADFVQQRSGDVAFIEIQPVGARLSVGDEFATLETVKVDVALASPVAGEIVRANSALAEAPETINQDPYGEGWICEIAVRDGAVDQTQWLDAAAYIIQMKAEIEKEGRQ